MCIFDTFCSSQVGLGLSAIVLRLGSTAANNLGEQSGDSSTNESQLNKDGITLTQIGNVMNAIKTLQQPILLMVSFPDQAIAQKISHELLEKKWVACAQLGGVHSLYRWQNQLQSVFETCAQYKTVQSLYSAIQTFVLANHPYTTPEIIAIPIIEIAPDYYVWMMRELGLQNESEHV